MSREECDKMPKTILEVQHLEKYFGDNLVLRDIDFQVEPGEVISIIGVCLEKSSPFT